MPLGIIASSEIEAGIIIGQIRATEKVQLHRKTFYKGTLGREKPVVLSLCGVGKANAAHATTLLIERFGPEVIYILGVAGAYPSSRLRVGDIVIAEKEIYGDEGLETGTDFCTMEVLTLPLASIGSIRYFNEFPLLIPEQFGGFNNRGTFVTVSSCSGTISRALEREKRFKALCENMEGAAVAHVCALCGIPAVEIRGISNVIEDREPRPLPRNALFTASENVQRAFLDKLV